MTSENVDENSGENILTKFVKSNKDCVDVMTTPVLLLPSHAGVSEWLDGASPYCHNETSLNKRAHIHYPLPRLLDVLLFYW